MSNHQGEILANNGKKIILKSYIGQILCRVFFHADQ